jgi:uncharacterized protein YegL
LKILLKYKYKIYFKGAENMRDSFIEIVILLDKSESMYKLSEKILRKLDKAIQNKIQNKEKIKLSVVRFNEEIEYIYSEKEIDEIKELSKIKCITKGKTALYDAIGTTIKLVGRRIAIAEENEKPKKVIFMVITDGVENASIKYDKRIIRDMISHQIKKYLWKFVFIGIDIEISQEKEIKVKPEEKTLLTICKDGIKKFLIKDIAGVI